MSDPDRDPAVRMLLAIRYSRTGDIEGVEAITFPGWRDGAVRWSNPDATQAMPSLGAEEEVTLLHMPNARLVIRYG